MDIESKESKYLFKLLEYLYKNNLNWTFFICGNFIYDLEKSGVLTELTRHTIGNHNFSHSKISKNSIKMSHAIFKEKLDLIPNCFRSPRLEITKKILFDIYSLNYSFDSSLFGSRPFNIVIDGQEFSLKEIPLLDGGDYVFFNKLRWDKKRYLSNFRKKLEYHYQLGSTFSILFHNQYSNFEIWKEAIKIAQNVGYQLAEMNHSQIGL